MKLVTLDEYLSVNLVHNNTDIETENIHGKWKCIE